MNRPPITPNSKIFCVHQILEKQGGYVAYVIVDSSVTFESVIDGTDATHVYGNILTIKIPAFSVLHKFFLWDNDFVQQFRLRKRFMFALIIKSMIKKLLYCLSTYFVFVNLCTAYFNE